MERPGPKDTRLFHVLLAVDGSEQSLAAAKLVRDLRLKPGSMVDVVGVLTPRKSPGRSVLLHAFDEVKEVLTGAGLDVGSGLLHGHAAVEISNFADQHRPDLIVAGAKGLHTTLGVLLGGVVQQLVEYSHWPVLVVRAPYTGVRRVLLVTDGSRHSERASTYLAEFPLPEDVQVSVLHVLSPGETQGSSSAGRPVEVKTAAPLPAGDFPSPEDSQAGSATRNGEEIVNKALERLQAAGLEADSFIIAGEVAGVIMKHTQENSIDLVVSGSRGMSAVRGWFLGSVSRKLVHYAECSVLVVRGPEERE